MFKTPSQPLRLTSQARSSKSIRPLQTCTLPDDKQRRLSGGTLEAAKVHERWDVALPPLFAFFRGMKAVRCRRVPVLRVAPHVGHYIHKTRDQLPPGIGRVRAGLRGRGSHGVTRTSRSARAGAALSAVRKGLETRFCIALCASTCGRNHGQCVSSSALQCAFILPPLLAFFPRFEIVPPVLVPARLRMSSGAQKPLE